MNKDRRPSMSYGASELVSSGSRMRKQLAVLLSDAEVPRKYLIDLLNLAPDRRKTDYAKIRIPYALLPELADKAGFKLMDILVPSYGFSADRMIVRACEKMPPDDRQNLLRELQYFTSYRWTTENLPRVNDRIALISEILQDTIDPKQLSDEQRKMLETMYEVRVKRNNRQAISISTDMLELLSLTTGLSMRFLLGFLGGPKVISEHEYVDDIVDLVHLMRISIPSRLIIIEEKIRGYM